MRQLVLDHPADADGRYTLTGSLYRYLVQVLRATEGDTLEVRLPHGGLSGAIVERVDREHRTILLSLCSCQDIQRSSESQPAVESCFTPLVLFQWILKGQKMDQVIRQATETGVSHIVPVAGERSLVRTAESLGDSKSGRWQRIVREALQQSGSPVATQIHEVIEPGDIPGTMTELCGQQASAALVLTEAPLARNSLHGYLEKHPEVVALAIGAEGGLSDGEMCLLEEAGFQPVHFDTNVLRAETAALYGIAAVQVLLTEQDKWQLKE